MCLSVGLSGILRRAGPWAEYEWRDDQCPVSTSAWSGAHSRHISWPSAVYSAPDGWQKCWPHWTCSTAASQLSCDVMYCTVLPVKTESHYSLMIDNSFRNSLNFMIVISLYVCCINKCT